MRQHAAILLVLAAVLSCAGTPAAQTAGVVMKGSDTIGGALGPAWAARFMELQPGYPVTVEALGSTTGFTGLLDGSAGIAAASRPVKEAELQRAAELGITFEELVVGYDGIAVIVHPDNPVRRLTLSQLADIFSGAVVSWREVGGDPVASRIISRPSYSGTHSFFKAKVLADGFAVHTEWYEHNEDIITEVAGDPTAISYVGLGWISPEIRAVAIAPSSGTPAVPPDLESVKSGTYPIYRPLLLYTAGPPTGAVRRFLAFVLSEEGRRLVAEHGFVPTEFSPELPVAEAGDQGQTVDPNRPTHIRFRSSGHQLQAADRRALAAVAAAVAAGGHRVLVSGHTDSLGRAEHNRSLSLQRARAVAAQLVALGVPVDLITVTGEGSDRPLASNETAEGRWQNRRVDVLLVDFDQ